jgi:hypothetical protein
MTHRLRLTVPADHHVEFDLPEEITGEVEIIVRPLAPTAGVTAEQAARRAALAREMQRTSPVFTTDSTDIIREDRNR